MTPGTVVVLTADGPMGTLVQPWGGRFADETVTKGERGYYRGPHDELPQWHIVEFRINGERRYCPLPEMAFAAAE